MKWNVREKNGQYKGGRVVASNGYVLLLVGKGHHLADCRGYAYEHRVVAEQKIGRRLLPQEQVHHKDQDRQNNHPDNLEVKRDAAHHRLEHRVRADLRLPGEPNPEVPCECGCGWTLLRYDEHNRPRRFLSGHNPHPSPTADRIAGALLAAGGPMSVPELTAATGIGTQALKVCLSKMKARGQVRHLKRGQWAAEGRG